MIRVFSKNFLFVLNFIFHFLKSNPKLKKVNIMNPKILYIRKHLNCLRKLNAPTVLVFLKSQLDYLVVKFVYAKNILKMGNLISASVNFLKNLNYSQLTIKWWN